MPRTLRHMPQAGTLFEITNRTIQGRLLLRPSAELNDTILACLGRALALHPHLDLCAFHGWRDAFWAGRFHAIPVLDDEAQVARLRYLLSHGCKEGLVFGPSDWPGTSCLPALLEGKKLEGVWVDKAALRRPAGKGQGPGRVTSDGADGLQTEEACIRYPIPLAPLPCWAELTEEEHREKVRTMVADIEAETRERHAREDTRPLGTRRILAQHPHAAPKEVKRRRAPACHTARAALRKTYRTLYRAFATMYREASARLRAGDRGAVFPAHCFPPSLSYQGATGPP